MPHPENVAKHGFKKGERSKEESVRRARKAGIASGKARKEKGAMKRAIEKLFSMEPKGDVKEKLMALGYDPGNVNNADALVSTLFAMAMKGDKRAAEMLMQYVLQVSEDDRKTEESNARVSAIKENTGDMEVKSDDGEDGGLVIYLPQIDEEEAEKVNDDDAAGDENKSNEGE